MATLPLRRTKNQIKGGEIVSRMLAAEGVDTVFGIIDGTYFGLYSTLGANGIRLVTPRHESSGVHMAGAYARTTGQLGVCLASNGPGVANALSGVCVEQAEGNRVLLITSSRREGISYPERGGTFQYFPQVEVTRPMTKGAWFVPAADRVAEILQKALRVAYTGRPGVVHVDIPESVLNGSFDLDDRWLRPPSSYRVTEPIAAPTNQVKEAARMLASAKAPLIHAGTGVVHAGVCEELTTLATLLEAPITTSWGARCAIAESSRYALPMVHMPVVNQARCDADTILVLGSRLGETDWWGKAPYWAQPEDSTTIQVDIDPAAIGNNRPVDLGVLADVKVFMQALIAELRGMAQKGMRGRKARVTRYGARIAGARAKLDKKHLSDRSVPMHSAHVPTICQEVFEDDAIVVFDGGNTAIWGNFFHQVKRPHTLLGTPKMGMLGAGVPQALGAKLAAPGKQVYCLIGDGAMGMQQQEIETAVRNGIQVIYLVFCDRQWGMVKMNQQFTLKPIKTLLLKSLGPDETINGDLGETRFDDLARAMGAHGERVADPAGLKGAIERSLASGLPAVIHVDVDPVKHMWAPALKEFKDMHAEPAG